jgi:hypothetical protein
LPFVVPTIPVFSFSSDAVGLALRNLTPTQTGSTSRIGAALYAAPPIGVETATTAWGFMAGAAPPGSSILAITATGFGTLERGTAWTFGGYARAYGDISITVEEFVFEPLKPVHSGLVHDPDPGIEHAEIAPPPTAMPGRFVFKRAVTNAPTLIINQVTTAIGVQHYEGDGTAHSTAFVMPITPGNAYRWWIASLQSVVAQGVSGPAFAGCNITFDFGPVFFAFN